MSTSSRITVSLGTLLELRRKLELVRRGKNVLEMKRDQLVSEVYRLMREVGKRDELEGKLIEVFRDVRRAYVVKGPEVIRSYLGLVKSCRIEVLYKSFLGVKVPEIRFVNDFDVEKIPDLSLRELMKRLATLLKELIILSTKEEAIENLSKELIYVNRTVNALDRKLLPELRELIRYISNRLQERTLEDFVRIKKTRDKLQVGEL